MPRDNTGKCPHCPDNCDFLSQCDGLCFSFLVCMESISERAYSTVMFFLWRSLIMDKAPPCEGGDVSSNLTARVAMKGTYMHHTTKSAVIILLFFFLLTYPFVVFLHRPIQLLFCLVYPGLLLSITLLLLAPSSCLLVAVYGSFIVSISIAFGAIVLLLHDNAPPLLLFIYGAISFVVSTMLLLCIVSLYQAKEKETIIQQERNIYDL